MKHKPRVGGSDQGQLIDMGLGPGKQVNSLKKQRKEMLKDIESDVKLFMKDFEEQKQAASVFDDAASSVSGVSGISGLSQAESRISE